MISIEDLGILREVTVDEEGRVEVTITPTYSGCPAMNEIASDVRSELAAEGFANASVKLVLAPAWNTDMITERGRRALHDFGIAPPGPRGAGPVPVTLSTRRPTIQVGMPTEVLTRPKCPQCGSAATHEISRFGSTSCKALHRCEYCLEPFDYFKAL